MYDRLNEIFEAQEHFADLIHDPTRPIEDITKDYALHIGSEAFEILNKVKWKSHRGGSVMMNRENVIEEIIDVVKLAIGLAHRWGVNPEEFVDRFMRKSEVVSQRYFQEHLDLSQYPKVAAVDIDGVLADYDTPWLEYIRDRANQYFVNTDCAKDGLGIKQYEELKDEYRRTGVHETLRPTLHAQKFLQGLKQKNYLIILISGRPYRRYLRIFSDTQQWLKKNKLVYDCLYFDRQKHLRIIELVPHLSFMIEDDRETISTIRRIGYQVYYPTIMYLDRHENDLARPYCDLLEILEWID